VLLKAKARLRIDKLCVRETQQRAEQEESKTDAAISKSVNGSCDATEEDTSDAFERASDQWWKARDVLSAGIA
jgi:hypothetical protein